MPRHKQLPTVTDPRLTPRQKQIVALAHEGRTNTEIGRALGLRSCNVKVHLNQARKRTPPEVASAAA